MLAGQLHLRSSVDQNPDQPGIVLIEAAIHEERYYHDELTRTDRDRATAADDVEVRTAQTRSVWGCVSCSLRSSTTDGG